MTSGCTITGHFMILFLPWRFLHCCQCIILWYFYHLNTSSRISTDIHLYVSMRYLFTHDKSKPNVKMSPRWFCLLILCSHLVDIHAESALRKLCRHECRAKLKICFTEASDLEKEGSSLLHLLKCNEKNDGCLGDCKVRTFEECFATCEIRITDCFKLKEGFLGVIRCARSKREECKKEKCHMKKSIFG